jgi:hypothetical protein
METMFSFGGVLGCIPDLQNLQHLRLGNCITASLTRNISLWTRLTSLEVLHGAVDRDPAGSSDDNPYQLMVCVPATHPVGQRCFALCTCRVILVTEADQLARLVPEETSLHHDAWIVRACQD